MRGVRHFSGKYASKTDLKASTLYEMQVFKCHWEEEGSKNHWIIKSMCLQI